MPRAKPWPIENTLGPCGRLGHVWGHMEDEEWWCAICVDSFLLAPGTDWIEAPPSRWRGRECPV